MGSKPSQAKSRRALSCENKELKSVRIGRMRVAQYAQREINLARVDYLAADFCDVRFGTPEVSFRDGYYYIMDGQHRIEALKKFLVTGWEDSEVDCWVSTGLSEEDEAEAFLRLNDTLRVGILDKFKVAVHAGREEETAVIGIVESEGLKVSKSSSTGDTVQCVGTLMKVYRRDGAESLRRALRLARDAYGDAGMDATVINGFGMLCHRYNGNLDEKLAIKALGNAHGGVNGLLGSAEQLRQKTGNQKAHCVAAAAVDIINRDLRGSKRLPSWWKVEETPKPSTSKATNQRLAEGRSTL